MTTAAELIAPPKYPQWDAFVAGHPLGTAFGASTSTALWTGRGWDLQMIGLSAALFPSHWLGLFSAEPEVLQIGTTYLRIVGPAYGFFGLGLAFYFASQGAGRLLWPLLAGLSRLVVAAGGGWIVRRLLGPSLAAVFVVMALALALFGTLVSVAMYQGAWRLRRQS